MFLIAPACLFAGAEIEVNNPVQDIGTIYERETEKVIVPFVVKNSGDEPLKIERVYSDCQCTVVEYDSVIQPDQIDTVKAALNLKGLRSGKYDKHVRIVTNAENGAVHKLTIKANVQALIDISTTHAILYTQDSLPVRIFIASQIEHLYVKSVDLTPADVLDMDDAYTIPIAFKWLSPDSIRADGYRVYALDLYVGTLTGPMHGVVTITTNSRLKKTLQIRGSIM